MLCVFEITSCKWRNEEVDAHKAAPFDWLFVSRKHHNHKIDCKMCLKGLNAHTFIANVRTLARFSSSLCHRRLKCEHCNSNLPIQHKCDHDSRNFLPFLNHQFFSSLRQPFIEHTHVDMLTVHIEQFFAYSLKQVQKINGRILWPNDNCHSLLMDARV